MLYNAGKRNPVKKLIHRKEVGGLPCWICCSSHSKEIPEMQKSRVQSPGREDSLEKEVGRPSSILAWRIPWT